MMIETDEAERAALRDLLKKRRHGSFFRADEARRRSRAMIMRRRLD